MNTLPDFAPLMLTGLRYGEAVTQMKTNRCAIRRPHWCTPVLVWDFNRIALDDEGELSEWTPDIDDKSAADWMMVSSDVAGLPTQPTTQSKG